MKKLILIPFLSILFSSPIEAKEAPCKVIKVTDGDTIQIENVLDPDLKLSIRIDNIDTPEKGSRAKCTQENALAQKATLFTKKMIEKATKVTCSFRTWDKYGGRILGDVTVDGKNLSDLLVKNGLAREYHGEKKGSWCE